MRARAVVVATMLAACAPGFPDVPEDCRVGEIVTRVRVPPSERTDLVLVIDTHATTAESSDTIARRLAAIVRVLASGDSDRDGHSDLFAIHDGLEAEVASKIAELPECARSAPGETAARCSRPRPASCVSTGISACWSSPTRTSPARPRTR
jgi:hypothetical protein